MNKKMISILVCIVFLAAVLPVSSSVSNKVTNETSIYEESSNYNTRYSSDFPVMDVPLSFLEPDVLSPKPIPKPTPQEFSWLDYNGEDWTTPVKNQGNCGSCWAFAALGVFESVIKLAEDCVELNPDLSEQYVLSCLPESGSCRGGSAYEAFELIKSTSAQGNYNNGVIPTSCFEYEADHKVPCTDKCGNWEDLLVPLLNFESWDSDGSKADREKIKTQVMEEGPVVTHMRATDTFSSWGLFNHNPNSYFWSPRPVYGLNHVVVIVGWKDSILIPNGGYWICKNSWGPEWGYNGFFNIVYRSLNIDNHWIITADYDPDSYDWAPYADTGGPYGGFLNQGVTFDASGSIGYEGEIVDYSWDFGDENTGSGVTETHTYENLGIYTVTLTVTDSEGNSATEQTNIWIQETNEGPATPSINGPNSGGVWQKYEYEISSTDPDDNDLLYYIDWGDGELEEWIGPYSSGEEIVVSHLWAENTNGEIKVKAKDPFGEESDWGTLNVNMPRTRSLFTSILFNFFKHLLNWLS